MGNLSRLGPRVSPSGRPLILNKREYSFSVLLGLVTLASVLPLLLLGIVGLSAYVAEEQADQLNRLNRYNETLASAVDRELRGYLDLAEVLAASRYLAEGDLKAFGQLARDAGTRARGHIVLIDPSGQQLVNTRTPTDENLPLTEDMESLREVVQSGNPAVGDLFVGAISNQLLFVIRVPVIVDGEVRYVLSFEPELDVIRKVIEQTFLPDEWRAAVIDGNGRMVARSSQHEQFYGRLTSEEWRAGLQGPYGFIEAVDFEGREVLTSYRRSGASDWYILIWAPKSALNDPLYRSLFLALGLAAMMLLASIAAGLLAGRAVARPIQQLLDTAQAIEAGQPVEFQPTHQREANIVGHALAEAARSIAAREQALRKSELHTRFVMRELAHRSKNLLAVVQAIARQTGRSARDIDDFTAQFGERLAGLGRSQDLLVQKNWQGVSLSDLVSAQLKPFVEADNNRVDANGPPVLLDADAAQNIGMALHELATNASKHGALSVPTGRVDIAWGWLPSEIGERGRRLQLQWSESGGPPVTPPKRKGFGHSVIERLTASSLHGTAKLDWRPEGLLWTLEVPEGSITKSEQNEVEASSPTQFETANSVPEH